MSSAYLIDGKAFQLNSPECIAAMAKAYPKKTRPLCLCRKPGIPMYIAKLSESGDHKDYKFVIKRMPDTGSRHTAGCESYEPPAELSGLGEVQGRAIKEDPDGLTELKLGFALTKVLGRRAPEPHGEVQETIKSDTSKLTLRSLMHYLWDQAGLTKWKPDFNGKRNWSVVHRLLHEAALGMSAKGDVLAENLYIPEPFVLEKKDEIIQRRKNKMSQLTVTEKGGRKLMVLIGEIKETSPARFGDKITIKHVPDFPFFIDSDMIRRVIKNFKAEWELFNAHEDSHMIISATFSIGSSGGVGQIEEMALMLTNAQWIPFSNASEKELLDKLVDRSHVRGLRYNMIKDRPIALSVLNDTAVATALYVTPVEASDIYKLTQSELIASSELQSWVWDVAEIMPNLPEKNKLTTL